MKNYRIYTNVEGMGAIEVAAASVAIQQGTVCFIGQDGTICAAFLLSQIVGFSEI